MGLSSHLHKYINTPNGVRLAYITYLLIGLYVGHDDDVTLTSLSLVTLPDDRYMSAQLWYNCPPRTWWKLPVWYSSHCVCFLFLPYLTWRRPCTVPTAVGGSTWPNTANRPESQDIGRRHQNMSSCQETTAFLPFPCQGTRLSLNFSFRIWPFIIFSLLFLFHLWWQWVVKHRQIVICGHNRVRLVSTIPSNRRKSRNLAILRARPPGRRVVREMIYLKVKNNNLYSGFFFKIAMYIWTDKCAK